MSKLDFHRDSSWLPSFPRATWLLAAVGLVDEAIACVVCAIGAKLWRAGIGIWTQVVAVGEIAVTIPVNSRLK